MHTRGATLMTLLYKLRRHGRAVLFGAAAPCLAAIRFLAFGITRDLRLLNPADSDDVQWTLSQGEVDFLELQHALDRARIAPDSVSALEDLVVRRDTFMALDGFRAMPVLPATSC